MVEKDKPKKTETIEHTVRTIRRLTREKYTAEDKIRIVEVSKLTNPHPVSLALTPNTGESLQGNVRLQGYAVRVLTKSLHG